MDYVKVPLMDLDDVDAYVNSNRALFEVRRNIHSICIEIEQLRRFDKIVYEKPRKRTGENNRITEKE